MRSKKKHRMGNTILVFSPFSMHPNIQVSKGCCVSINFGGNFYYSGIP